MVTASIHYMIPVLIGTGLTDGQARAILMEAQALGVAPFVTRNKTKFVTYQDGKYTVGSL